MGNSASFNVVVFHIAKKLNPNNSTSQRKEDIFLKKIILYFIFN